MSFSNVDDLLSFSKLLSPPTNDDDGGSGRRPSSSSSTAITPGSFGAPRKDPQVEAAAAAAAKKKKEHAKDIWDEAEVPLEDAILAEDLRDSRPRPKYDILYKMDVGTEDVFLGLGDKSPSTVDCTHMTVKACFPGHSLRDLDLDVTKHKLRAESKTMLLSIFLPLPVASDRGKATWDAKKQILSVCLPIIKDEW